MPDEMRALLKGLLKRSQEDKERAEERFYIDVLNVSEKGLTLKEVSTVLQVSEGTIVTWKRKGEQARDRRHSQDPERPSERDQDS